MGLKENLIANWKDKTIEYQEKKFYILEQFEYEGLEYLYGIDINTIDNEVPNVVFLHKVKDDEFEHIEDEKLFDLLILRVAGIMTSKIITEELKNRK